MSGGRRAPYLDSRAGWVPQAAKNVFKKACVDGLISGFGGQACSCHSDAAGCGQKGEGRHAAGAERGRTCPAGSSGDVRPSPALALGPVWGFWGSFGLQVPVSVSHSLSAIQHFSS